jgi:hypothetical protein
MEITGKSVKIIIILLFLSMKAVQVIANVDYIDISKISSESNLVIAFNFIKSNKHYYDRWTNEWSHDKSKKDLIDQLRNHYNSFSALPTKNVETYLLLGDIAHYLFNMEDDEYYYIAVNNYKEAMKKNPKDYRAFWFLASHYIHSGESILAIENFKKAEKLLPSKQSSDFWNDYAYIAAQANMPTHSIYAMDKVKGITGEDGIFQQRLGETIYQRIISVDKEQFYEWDDIWIYPEIQDKRLFISRPLGIKVQLDTAWNVNITNYKDKQTGFIIYPPTIANRNGKDILYTVLVMMKTADKNETLDDFINRVTSKHPVKKKITYSDKYDKMIAYEIINKTFYQNMGGAHMLFIGIERDEPEYPGLLLEIPFEPPKTSQGNNSDRLTFWRPIPSKDRFKGKIFYIIVLDTCEDIYKQTLPVFKSLFDNQIIIE